jgi:AraC-like DNA-binding protein
MNPITVEAIASRLGLNRSYFSTLFKRTTGVSPKRYLFDYRMRIAGTLLREKRTAVSVAANSVGYGDIFNFSKMFKRAYGCSPLEYAKGKD